MNYVNLVLFFGIYHRLLTIGSLKKYVTRVFNSESFQKASLYDGNTSCWKFHNSINIIF